MAEQQVSNDHVDLCIIGSGSGLSLVNDDLGDWKIVVIDDGLGVLERFGGTCLNAGCIPTKMFAVPAHYAMAPAEAAAVDTEVSFSGIDYPALKMRIFGRTDGISSAGLSGLTARPNVEVIFGAATFVDAHTIKVGQRIVSADRIVVAAGSRPRGLDLPGFDDPYLQAFIHTSETIMRLAELPRRMVILGGGVEAVEFGHIYAALGVHVTVISRSAPLLRKLDSSIAEAATEALAGRVAVRLNQQVTGLEPEVDGGVVVSTVDATGIEYSYESDVVLLAMGRIPNGDQLMVENAGITLTNGGFVPVDEYMRTPVPHIWALGDVCAPKMLKHLANQQARVVKHNLLAERDGQPLVATREEYVPLGVFGHPEIASVGATSADLDRAGIPHVEYIHEYGWTAYGWALNDTGHFVKLIADETGEKLLGAHIVGPQATTLIQVLQFAMTQQMAISTMISGQYWIHPALTEVVENALIGVRRAARG